MLREEVCREGDGFAEFGGGLGVVLYSLSIVSILLSAFLETGNKLTINNSLNVPQANDTYSG